MKKSNPLFLYLYLGIAMVHIYCGAAGVRNIETLSKYLLMPALAVHIIVNVRHILVKYIWLLAAVLFSWAGDVFLLYTGRSDDYFLYGLAAFLLAHLFYIVTFSRLSEKNVKSSFKNYILLLPFIYAVLLVVWVYNGLGDMKIPVIVYAVVITLMLVAAMRRKGRTSEYSYLFVVIGAALFVGSDSLIAVTKFRSYFNNAGIYIMLTYIAAQYFIVSGCLLHGEEENSGL